MGLRSAKTFLLLAGMGLGLSGCYYAPAPGYAYDSGYYAPSYYAPAYYSTPAYYGPSVGVYYGGGWRRDRWH